MRGMRRHEDFAVTAETPVTAARPLTTSLGSGTWTARRTTGTWPSGPFTHATLETSVASAHILTPVTETFTSNFTSVNSAGTPGFYFTANSTYSEVKFGSGALNLGRSLLDINQDSTIGDEDYYWTNISTPTTTSVSSDLAPGTGDFTIEFWIYPSGTNISNFVNPYYGVLARVESDYINPNTNSGIAWSISLRDNPFANPGDWFSFACIDSSTNTVSEFTANITVSSYEDTWVHLAVARSGGNLRMYVGGTLTSTTAISSNITPTSWPADQTRLKFGSQLGDDLGTEFNGSIDEVRISNTARYVGSFTPSAVEFDNDSRTLALLHFNGNTDDDVDVGYMPDGYAPAGYVAIYPDL